MKNKYFKKFWNDTTGGEVTDSWGNCTYYFEADENLNVLKQVQIFENKKILKYHCSKVKSFFEHLHTHLLRNHK